MHIPKGTVSDLCDTVLQNNIVQLFTATEQTVWNFPDLCRYRRNLRQIAACSKRTLSQHFQRFWKVLYFRKIFVFIESTVADLFDAVRELQNRTAAVLERRCSDGFQSAAKCQTMLREQL